MVTDISAPKPRIAIFGGTFDPIHLGHINSVKLLCEHLEFDRVHFVLSARPPHKGEISASIEDRFTMLKLALDGDPQFIADDTEIRRQTKSYTIDTVETFKTRYPNCSISVIIGGDSLLSLPTWHRYAELLDQSNWVVLNRPGFKLQLPAELAQRLVASPAGLNSVNDGQIWVFQHSEFAISSSEIRAELSNQPSVGPATERLAHKPLKLCKEFLSESVFNYIKTQQLYRIRGMKPEQVKDQVVAALEDIKGHDIRVIDIADISDFADFMVVASGTSDTHVKALARSASDSLRKQGVKPLNQDGADVGEWVLVDFGDVVLHVMRPEVREYYDLEKLWDEDVRALVKKHRAEQDD